MVANEKWFGASAGFYNGVATQSLRLNTPDDPRLTRTPSSGGNRKTWTFSIWIKRGVITVNQVLFGAYSSGAESGFSYLSLHADDQIGFDAYGTSYFHTNRLLRDTTGWTNLVFAVDTSQSTSGDRVKLYVNGVQDSSFASGSMPSLNLDTAFNDTCQHTLFANHYNGSYDGEVSGYVSDVNFVDGSQLTASSFGEFKNGVWIPIDTSGLTFGTNGFRLQFKQTGTGTASTSTIGADTSGNTNHFTTNNLSAHDSNLPDCPENNWCTFNVVEPSGITLSEGSLYATVGSGFKLLRSTFFVASGKWYWEILSKDGGNGYIGASTSDEAITSRGAETNLSAVLVTSDGDIRKNASESSYGNSVSDGDVIGVALDMDNGKIYFSENGTYYNSGNPASSTNPATTGLTSPLSPSVSLYDNEDYIANFGQDGTFNGEKTAGGNSDGNGKGNFFSAVPTGFLALCSANLPETTISPNADNQSSDFFTTYLHTGDGVDGRSLTGMGFQPDFHIIKNRSNSGNDTILTDSARGETQLTMTGNYADNPSTNKIESLDADGFTVGQSVHSTVNADTQTYVSWNWKAGGAPTATNSAGAGATPTSGSVKIDGSNLGSALAGSIPATKITANTTSGFSIVLYTGNNSSSGTIAHGLSSAPTLILVWGRTVENSNMVGLTAYNGWTHYITFSGSGYSVSDSTIWNNTAPTSTVFSVGGAQNVNDNYDYVAWCWHDVEGYSKIGTYKGNSNADGTYVYTGFSVKWLMIKKASAGENFVIWDKERDTFNVRDSYLIANTTAVETVYGGVKVDFLSNGFKFRGNEQLINDSSHTFIYMAFAENPFKYSNAK